MLFRSASSSCQSINQISNTRKKQEMMETFLLHHNKAKAGSMAGSGDPALGSTQLPCYGWPSVAHPDVLVHPFCLSDVKVHPFFLSDVKVWFRQKSLSSERSSRQTEKQPIQPKSPSPSSPSSPGEPTIFKNGRPIESRGLNL